MTLTTRTIATLAVLALAAASPAQAQREPTLSDIASCNEQAASRTGASALPHPGSPTPAPAPRGDSKGSGVVPGPSDPGVGKAPAPAPRAGVPMPGTGGPGEKTDSSGAIIAETPDPYVKGMDASKVDDPQYRAAYRDCMRGKLSAR